MLENKKLLWSLFSSANYTTEQLYDWLYDFQLYILQDYSSARIDFNMINKRHALLVVCTMLV